MAKEGSEHKIECPLCCRYSPLSWWLEHPVPKKLRVITNVVSSRGRGTIQNDPKPASAGVLAQVRDVVAARLEEITELVRG